MPDSNLTPAQQTLVNFLDKLATAPYSPELITEGNQALDAAVEEHRRLGETIHQTSSAIATHRSGQTRE
jgi:hypothetical protein